jgi:hypothetical protein
VQLTKVADSPRNVYKFRLTDGRTPSGNGLAAEAHVTCAPFPPLGSPAINIQKGDIFPLRESIIDRRPAVSSEGTSRRGFCR